MGVAQSNVMTIKRRLLISHLAMFVMPLVMAAVIILSAAGAVMLGGCCRTTPADIAALRARWPRGD